MLLGRAQHGGQAEACAARRSARGEEPLRILIVDDQPDVAQVTRLILETRGHIVEALNQPNQALRKWTEGKTEIDLVICDVAMAQMRGPELIARMSAEGQTPRVLFMTGYSEEAVHAALGHPVLRKPFTAAALLNAVDDLVRR